MLPFPTFSYEQSLWQEGFLNVIGMDEVGRGAFAGPVITAAVILPQSLPDVGIHDSKLLSKHKREYLSEIIKEKAQWIGIGEVCVACINTMGVGKATQKAFLHALKGATYDHILMDAFYVDTIEKARQTPLIKGDQKSLSIAAASIIAKVYRDSLMKELAKEYPPYGFEQHVGYGTAFHRDAIKQHGLSIHHRVDFCENSLRKV